MISNMAVGGVATNTASDLTTASVIVVALQRENLLQSCSTGDGTDWRNLEGADPVATQRQYHAIW